MDQPHYPAAKARYRVEEGIEDSHGLGEGGQNQGRGGKDSLKRVAVSGA